MNIYVMPRDQLAGCLLFAFAMLLETEPDDLIKEIGHDGMEKIWPELKEPYCFKGFHIQELLDCCYSRGKYLFPIDGMPTSLPPPLTYIHMPVHNVGPHILWDRNKCTDRFKEYLTNHQGVLIGETKKQAAHAWAWDSERAHDPREGMGTAKLDDLKIREAWLIAKSL